MQRNVTGELQDLVDDNMRNLLLLEDGAFAFTAATIICLRILLDQ